MATTRTLTAGSLLLCWLSFAGSSCNKNGPGPDEKLPPAAPTLTRISAQNNEPTRGLAISFKDNSDEETGFLLEKENAAGTYLPLASLPANTTQYVDWGLDVATNYFYRVCAYNDHGQSAWSEGWGKSAGPQFRQLPRIVASADTWVDSTYHTANYGSDNNLLVTRETRPDGGSRKAYVTFPLNSIPSHARYIEEAELRLFTLNELTDGGPNLHLRLVLESWSEGGLTWDSKPEVSFAALDANQRVYTDGQPYYWDVTGAVRDWYEQGVPNYGIQLEATTFVYQAVFLSREHASAVRPTLLITYEW